MYRQLRPPPVRTFDRAADPSLARRGLTIAKCYYFCYFGAIGCLIPFFNVYLERQGLTGTQIGWLNSIPPLIALFANPFWGAFADRWQAHRYVLMGLTFMAGLISLLFLTSVQFWAIMLFIVSLTFFRRPVSAILDSTTINLVKQHGNTSYGRQRLWGSLGFVITSYSLGQLISNSGLDLVFWFHAFMLTIACTAFGLFLPVEGGKKRVNIMAGLQDLVKRRSYIGFLISVILLGYGMTSYITFLSLYMLELGGSEVQLGLVWVAMAIIEVPVMYLGSRWFERYGYSRILQLSFIGFTLSWLAMTFAMSPIYLIINVLFVGISFSSFWVSVVNYASEAAPPGLSATAQALTGAVQSGIGGSLGAICSGYLWDVAGATTVFLAAAVAAALAGLSFWVGNRV